MVLLSSVSDLCILFTFNLNIYMIHATETLNCYSAVNHDRSIHFHIDKNHVYNGLVKGAGYSLRKHAQTVIFHGCKNANFQLIFLLNFFIFLLKAYIVGTR